MRKAKAGSEGSNSKSAALRKQMDDLKAELRQVENAEEASFGKMARRAGLFDLDVSDKDLKEAIAKMVETFRSRGSQSSKPAEEPQT